MHALRKKTKKITNLVLKAAREARKDTDAAPEPALTKPIQWPVQCIVGPGLEGAIACESKIGYVNGSKGCLIYRGYDIFDLCAHSTFEEVSYLLLHGTLPTRRQLEKFNKQLVYCRNVADTLRVLLNFPLREMSSMAGLRLGAHLMRQEFSYADQDGYRLRTAKSIGADEDSIPMETVPRGEEHAIYEFAKRQGKAKDDSHESAVSLNACYHLIGGLATITGAIGRIRGGHFPIEPNPKLSHAANLLCMITGHKPTPEEERIMDISLILHADHGINASTFASMVVASTLSDLYFSVGAGIAALSGPLHGGANERVIQMLNEIGSPERVRSWFRKARQEKRKIMGFGHRVYKAYDPRARVLYPLARLLAGRNPETARLFAIAETLEREVVSTLGKEKKIFPNVDFYSGIVYHALGIPVSLFTPIFAVSRVSGWTARVMEYLENNRIFRPRAIYTGAFNRKYEGCAQRKK